MLGDTGTEQFVVTTTQDGKLVAEQRIHDPFIHSTTTIAISRWDLFKAMFRRQFKIKLCVSVSGSAGAQQAIMTLDPADLEMRTAQMLFAAQQSRASYVGQSNCCAAQAPE